MDTIGKVDVMDSKESYARTFAYDAKDDIVWMTQGTQLGKGDEAFSVHFRYGMKMGNLTEDELKINAAKNLHITVMRTRVFKKAQGPAAIEAMPMILDPCDYPATGGAGITTKERNIRFMVDTMGLTRELAEHFAENPDKLKAAVSNIKK